MTKRLAIFGGGGHGKVAAMVAESLDYDVVFFDDAYPEIKSCGKWAVVGNFTDLEATASDYDAGFVAIGNNAIRRKIFQRMSKIDVEIVNLIASTAAIDSSVTLGRGILVVGNSAVNIDATLGDGVIINTNAVVEHDCHIGDFVHISPNASIAGTVTIGAESWIGIGSAVIQQINIGENVMVGAGSVVINDIQDNQKAVGSPTRIIS